MKNTTKIRAPVFWIWGTPDPENHHLQIKVKWYTFGLKYWYTFKLIETHTSLYKQGFAYSF